MPEAAMKQVILLNNEEITFLEKGNQLWIPMSIDVGIQFDRTSISGKATQSPEVAAGLTSSGERHGKFRCPICKIDHNTMGRKFTSARGVSQHVHHQHKSKNGKNDK
jgi:hypothetical protein